MQDRVHPTSLVRSRRTPLLAAVFASAILVTGCGGSSPSSAAATAGGTRSSASTVAAGGGSASSGSTAAGAYGSGPLAFSKCMATHVREPGADRAANTAGTAVRAVHAQPPRAELPRP